MNECVFSIPQPPRCARGLDNDYNEHIEQDFCCAARLHSVFTSSKGARGRDPLTDRERVPVHISQFASAVHSIMSLSILFLIRDVTGQRGPLELSKEEET